MTPNDINCILSSEIAYEVYNMLHNCAPPSQDEVEGRVRRTLAATLIENNLSDEEKNEIKKALVKAGAPDKSFKGVLKASLKQLGKKVAQDAGEAIAEKAGDFISPIIDASVDKVSKLFKNIFNSQN